MTRHYMVDLETMSLYPNAAIIQIGAVEFDKTGILGTFERNVSLESSVEAGLHMDPKTVSWWMKQDVRTWEKDPDDLYQALAALSYWIDDGGKQKGDLTIWGDGAAFDPVVLQAAYEACQLPRWWRYNQVRCYRTMKNMFPKAIRPEEAVHDALGDAMGQAAHLINICAGYDLGLSCRQVESGCISGRK